MGVGAMGVGAMGVDAMGVGAGCRLISDHVSSGEAGNGRGHSRE